MDIGRLENFVLIQVNRMPAAFVSHAHAQSCAKATPSGVSLSGLVWRRVAQLQQSMQEDERYLTS